MASLDAMRRNLERKTRRAADSLASDWESELRRNSPVDTGFMRSHTNVRSRTTTRGAEVEAIVDTDYAEMVRSGTRPHVIRPRTAQALRFQSGSQTVFARVVNHPGARPRTWWDDALRRLPDMAQRAWRGAR